MWSTPDMFNTSAVCCGDASIGRAIMDAVTPISIILFARAGRPQAPVMRPEAQNCIVGDGHTLECCKSSFSASPAEKTSRYCSDISSVQADLVVSRPRPQQTAAGGLPQVYVPAGAAAGHVAAVRAGGDGRDWLCRKAALQRRILQQQGQQQILSNLVCPCQGQNPFLIQQEWLHLKFYHVIRPSASTLYFGTRHQNLKMLESGQLVR